MPRRPADPARVDEPPPPVILARHVDRSIVAARVRSGQGVRVRPGAYLDAAHLEGRHRGRTLELARIEALGRQLTVDHVVSHESAALLWGLPVLREPTRTHVVQAASSRTACSPDVVRHVLELAGADRTVRFGRAVTTLERTVVDCAMARPAAAGLVVADAALRRGADRTTCLRLLATMGGRRGIVRARAVVELADGGAESPGREALLAEKRREDAIRAEGWSMLRVMSTDVHEPGRLLARITARVPADKRTPLTPRPALA